MYYHGCNMSKERLKKVACMTCPMFLNVTSNVLYLYRLLENMWIELAEIKILPGYKKYTIEHQFPAQMLIKANVSVQLGPINPP